MKPVVVVVAAGLLLSSFSAAARKSTEYTDAYVAGFQKIDFLVGEWLAKNAVPQRGEDGALVWLEVDSSRRSFRRVFDGAAIVDVEGGDESAFAGRPMRFQGMYSYDQFQNEYRIVYTDDNTGLLDVYEGTFRNGSLVVNNVAGGTFWETDGVKQNGQVIYTYVSPTRFDLVFEQSVDGGKTWVPAFRTAYHRLQLPGEGE